MVELLTYASPDLPFNFKTQILAAIKTIWPEGFIGPYQQRTWVSREEFHPTHIILVEQGVVFAHTVMIWKWLQHVHEIYKVYGLGYVFTHPAHRHQGYGRRIVRVGTQTIQASDADVAMLYCEPSLERFYMEAGWFPMTSATTVIGTGGKQFATNERLLMLFISDKGKRSRGTFEHEPIYFGDTTW